MDNIHSNAISIWFTGLSGAGKTTIANKLAMILLSHKIPVQVLDGDVVRKGINSDLGFSGEDRIENIRRAAEISKLFLNQGISTINSFICPMENLRNMAKSILGDLNFYLVYINAPLTVCEKRDPKGLYQRARKGEIKDFTGIDAAFEEPVNPFLEIKTDILTADESVKIISEKILPVLLKKIM